MQSNRFLCENIDNKFLKILSFNNINKRIEGRGNAIKVKFTLTILSSGILQFINSESTRSREMQ